MGKEKHKCTLRLSTDEIEQIEAYPGKNFTEKARSLFAAHAVEMDELPGEDLKEKYEILLKGYLSKFEPELWKEIESPREELKRYADTMKDIDELQDLVNDFRGNIEGMCEQSNRFIEQKVANCVVVRKKSYKKS